MKKLRKFRKLSGNFPAPALPTLKRSRTFSYPEVKAPEDPLEKAAVQGIIATLPERIIWKWLIDHDHVFQTQKPELGGVRTTGGVTADFVVYTLTTQKVVFRIQGEYWHGPEFPGTRAHDDEQAGRLRRRGYLVVDLQEAAIYEAVLDGRLTRYIESRLFL